MRVWETVSWGWSHSHICCAADSFQGSESDIVVLSLVRANPRSNIGFVKEYQRINVSITRWPPSCWKPWPHPVPPVVSSANPLPAVPALHVVSP